MFENCSHSLRPAAALRTGLIAAVFLLLSLLILSPREERAGMDSTEGRCAFLVSLGLDPDPGSENCKEIELPETFDAVLEQYNALQLAAGYDLRRGAGRKCLCCSYDLLSFPGWEGRVIATLYVCRGRVIGGDVHTADVRGFMRPLGNL